MSFLAGYPLYIEFTSEKKVFEIVMQEDHPASYDVDWCDSHGHYHAEMVGCGFAPCGPKHGIDSDGKKVPAYYWSMFTIPLQPEADPAYCIRLTTSDVLTILLPDEDIQREFLDLYEIPAPEDITSAFAGELIQYWSKRGYVEEGKVVYCSICDRHYDYEQNYPCDHVQWCEVCGMFSVPADECPHRSEDGKFYVAPGEADWKREE